MQQTATAMAAPSLSPDFAAIKQKQQATWAAGDYAVVGTTLQIVGEALCEAADICADEKVIDVAAGNGNATLAAARRYAEVTSTDYVSSLLELGRVRAEAELLHVTFQTADAEALPFADGSFDAALSTFGIMFTPNQPKAAAEISRVVRKGGRIGLANWTPDSFIGQLFKTIGRHLPPPPGLKPPPLWGTKDHLKELFPRHTVACETRVFNFRYRSPAHWLEVFRTYYGPTNRAFAALDAKGQAALADDILSLIDRSAEPGHAALVIPSSYLEAVIVKRE
ncbi:MAG: class I SAM-dependent methyltransferase [Aestuariivirga sp.]